jgi:hypothetical protein
MPIRIMWLWIQITNRFHWQRRLGSEGLRWLSPNNRLRWGWRPVFEIHFPSIAGIGTTRWDPASWHEIRSQPADMDMPLNRRPISMSQLVGRVRHASDHPIWASATNGAFPEWACPLDELDNERAIRENKALGRAIKVCCASPRREIPPFSSDLSCPVCDLATLIGRLPRPVA